MWRLNSIPIKITVGFSFFVENGKLILKFAQKDKGVGIHKRTSEKNVIQGHTPSDFKIY